MGAVFITPLKKVLNKNLSPLGTSLRLLLLIGITPRHFTKITLAYWAVALLQKMKRMKYERIVR